MSTTNYSLYQPHHAYTHVQAAVEGAGDLIHAVVKNVRREIIVRQAIRELNALGERELTDLGLCRAEIESAVRGHKR